MRKAQAKMEQKRERGAGSAYLRGNVWWIQYSVRGRKIRKPAIDADGNDCRTEPAALKALRKAVGAALNGIRQDSPSLKYDDIRDAFLASYALDGKKSLRRDRKGNVYLEPIKRLNEFFGGTPVVDITPTMIRKYQSEQRAAGYANGTINRSVRTLSAMFGLAAEDERLTRKPIFPSLPEAKPRQGTLPHEKYAELLAALPVDIRPVVAIAYGTGMRRSEILGLHWQNIKWMDRIVRIEDSKNGDAREIPFTGELEAVLKEQYAKRQEGCDFVCYRVNRRGHAQRVGNFRKAWSRVCVKLGLAKMEPIVDAAGNPVFEPRRYKRSKPKPKLRYDGLLLHDLRRTFISDAEHAGAPRHEAMTLSGHKTESVYRRYAIQNREQGRAALARIEAYRAQQNGHNTDTISTEEKPEVSVVQ
jgi:integrase